MGIISVSVDEKTSERINNLMFETKMSRSKIIRIAIASFESEVKTLPSGKFNAVITINYEEHDGSAMKGLLEKYENLIKTELHQHNNGICTRVLIVGGDGQAMKDMINEMRRKRSTRSVSINII